MGNQLSTSKRRLKVYTYTDSLDLPSEVKGLICGLSQLCGMKNCIAVNGRKAPVPSSLHKEYHDVIAAEYKTGKEFETAAYSFATKWKKTASLSSDETVRELADFGLDIICLGLERSRNLASISESMRIAPLKSFIDILLCVDEPEKHMYEVPLRNLSDFLGSCENSSFSSDRETAFKRYFTKGISSSHVILPIFSKRHGAYAVIEKLNMGLSETKPWFVVAIVNGGEGWEYFSEKLSVNTVNGSVQITFRVVVCLEEHIVEIIKTVSDCWYKDFIFSEVGALMNKLRDNDKNVLEPNARYLASGVPPIYLPDFLNKLLVQPTQVTGNCSIHNLMESIMFICKAFEMQGQYNESEVVRAKAIYEHCLILLQLPYNQRAIINYLDRTTFEQLVKLCEFFIQHYNQSLIDRVPVQFGSEDSLLFAFDLAEFKLRSV